MKELKATTINMKSLDQNISDPIIVGGGEANGRCLRIIFTQEAAKMFSSRTKVYLAWYNQAADIKGLNVFTKVQEGIYKIYYPQSMLHEGAVLACIKLVDDISIACSSNFIINVISDPIANNRFQKSDDFEIFKQATIDMNSSVEESKELMNQISEEFAITQEQFAEMQEIFAGMQDEINDKLLHLGNIVTNSDEGNDFLDKIPVFSDEYGRTIKSSDITIDELKNTVEKTNDLNNIIEEIILEKLSIAEY